ncbi:MAG: hypothetical protein OHK0022_58390 [Roseiflexaceae bacterium]
MAQPDEQHGNAAPQPPLARLISPRFEDAQSFLERAPAANLPLLAALEYDPVEMIWGIARGDALVALALVFEPDGPFTRQRSTVLLDALDSRELAELLARGEWPAQPRWTVHRTELLPAVQTFCGARPDRSDGVRHYVADRVQERPHTLVRRIVLEDADTLDLAPCRLSPVALRNWIKRGWRVFGAVDSGALLGHALAAYPVGAFEEVAAVFTAPPVRRQGIASAVVAAAAADILARGLRATYVCRKTNTASRRVAEGLGFAPLLETWEFRPDE